MSESVHVQSSTHISYHLSEYAYVHPVSLYSPEYHSESLWQKCRPHCLVLTPVCLGHRKAYLHFGGINSEHSVTLANNVLSFGFVIYQIDSF